MIVIIDYGMGNPFSIQSALKYLGVDSIITDDIGATKVADKLIMPGVGSFYKAMENIRERGLFKTITESVIEKRTPILGICLGMQLLGLSSTEDGITQGFGFVDSPVERFNEHVCADLKIPHVGFDSVSAIGKSDLFEGLDSGADFYFTHSYRMLFVGQPWCAGVCLHGEPFVAVFQKDNICGTQFHPEKSQANGLILLKNFVEKI